MKKRFIRAAALNAAVLGCLALSLSPGLFLAGCDNPAGESGPSAAAREEADLFRAAWSDILEKQTARVNLNDEVAIDGALAAYGALSAEAQALLSGEKEKLDSHYAYLGTRKASVVALRTYLEGKPENTVEDPYYAAYTGDETPAAIYKALERAGKYVSLDLSKSGVSGFEADTDAGRAYIVHLTLPDSLTITEDGTSFVPVFAGFTNLKTVSAAGLETLGTAAFYGNTKLEAIDLPSATFIGGSAFSGCTGLTTVDLPKADGIGGSAFYECSNLTAVNLPEVTQLWANAFQGCVRLGSVNVPRVENVGASAFAGCTALTEIDLSLAQLIGNYAFQNTGLSEMILPKATSIGNYAFSGCASLAAVDLPLVTSVGNRAFAGTGLTAIDLPKAASIGNNAFNAGLVTANLPEATYIYGSAFSGCTSLTTVNLPALTGIGSSAFYGCTSLAEIDLPLLTSVEPSVFTGCTSLVTVKLPAVTGNIGNYAFSDCTSLETVVLGNTPPAIRTTIFRRAAGTARTITFKVPNTTTYTGAGTPWTDKIGTNDGYWDNDAGTKNNLTVVLVNIGG
jgi:hypothetical protein